MCAHHQSPLDMLQDRLQYRFTDPELLRQSLVHRSWLNEATRAGTESNERLEFIGDAVLGAVVARCLFEDFPEADEGWMTVARSQLVRKETLADIARSVGVGPCLLMGAGIANEGGRERDTVLSRALEAVIGAVWMDGGDEAAESVILTLLADELDDVADVGVVHDAKSRLQQVVQSRRGAQPTYAIIAECGPHHDRSFRAAVEVEGESLAEGVGRSKQAAEMEAARLALLRFPEDSA
ncbi:MAG: ribonuclease III [Chloroflexi bacterium]|nr:ribonuclease III [Chloroflexota bacterium]MYD17594.1 ribonuclease III [Chloroflexota bacterium]MYJ02584.1 ribonuclease III [Chloroflexota bacterium]